MNLLQARASALSFFTLSRSPMPRTVLPPSRRRTASEVKSLSLETKQKHSAVPAYSASMASMIILMSDEFLPRALLAWYTGCME